MMLIIGDRNWQEYLHQQEDAGFRGGALPRQTNVGGLKCAKVYEEVIKPIPESEWEGRIKEAIERKAFPSAHLRAAKPDYKPTQNGLNYCWAWSLCGTMLVQRLTVGLSFIELAPESLGGDVNFRNAGNYLDSALAYAAKNGACERSFVPTMYSLRPSTYKTGWQDNALNHRPTEWFDLDGNSWVNTVSALLSGFPLYVGYDWWSHAVCLVGLVIIDGEICPEVFNSHADGIIVLSGSRKVPDLGSFAQRTTTWPPAA